ncbi:MAG: transposase [bacterium]|nr:transposase [bacterium]
MRNLQFAEGEIYHIYNRGVDKKTIFPLIEDLNRFFEGMSLFNTSHTIGSLSRSVDARRHGVSTVGEEADRLVNCIAYCLNPNHFHLILEQRVEKGIERYMHKLGMGHSKYINAKYKRSGALFQGSFKAIHIDSNEYLLHASAYVNLNDQIHGYRHGVSARSSWEEYVREEGVNGFCKKDLVLDQFNSRKDYRKFADCTLEDIVRRKELIRELEDEDIELVNTA